MNSRKIFVLFMITLLTFGAYDAVAGCESDCGGCDGTDTELKVFGESRYRLNTGGFDYDPDTPLNWFTEMRTRVGIKAKANDKVGAFFQLQDCRVVGDNPGLDFTNQDIQMHQGYFWYRPCDKGWFKAGRMAVGLHNERLVGKVGWSNTGRTFEGVMFGRQLNDNISLKGFSFQAGERNDIVLGIDADPNKPVGDPMFYGMNVNFEEQMFDLFFYMLMDDAFVAGEHDFNYSLMTFGAYSHRTFGSDMWIDAMFAMQSGSDETVDYSGMMFYAMLGKMMEKFGLFAGVDYTTGDDDLTDTDAKAFNNLFYTGHKFRGAMDMFVTQPTQGLMDLFAGGKYLINDQWKAGGTFHMFNSIEDLNVAGDTTYGTEIDLFAKFTAEDFSWTTGFSMSSQNEDVFGATDSQNWWYSMATVNY